MDEFAGQQNQLPLEPDVQMRVIAQRIVGKGLHYRDLAVGKKRGRVRVAQ